MQVRKQELELDMKQQTGSKLVKEYVKAVYCHPDSLTSMQSIPCEMLGWMKHKLESRLLGGVSITTDTQMTLLLEQKVKRRKSLLMKMTEESEEAGLNLQKMKVMASGPITSWQIDGETMETVINFIFLGSKITADGDCSHDKRCLLFGRRAVTNLGSILKSRDILC